MAVLADPEGAVFCVWQPKEPQGRRVVNENGSLNFNGLNTRDVEGAKRFYGAVFGWQALDLGGGGQMWMLPGYADLPGEERSRHSQADGGDRRSGGIRGRGRVDQPARRRPARHPRALERDVRVDDADATAAKAKELGGRVVVPPFDAPWVRMTILTDPGGAMFLANQFVPENRDPHDSRSSAAQAA
jgi:predicted enzyme related to lactoylglutathione lyase